MGRNLNLACKFILSICIKKIEKFANEPGRRNRSTGEEEVVHTALGAERLGSPCACTEGGLISSGHGCFKDWRGRQGRTSDSRLGGATRFLITHWAPPSQ